MKGQVCDCNLRIGYIVMPNSLFLEAREGLWRGLVLSRLVVGYSWIVRGMYREEDHKACLSFVRSIQKTSERHCDVSARYD